MTSLNMLRNTTRPLKAPKRVGRGPGSKVGKTCGRGGKGNSCRAGYKNRYGYEGGQFPLYRKMPCRGFTRGRFREDNLVVNLWQIEKIYQDGEVVNLDTLREKGCLNATKGRLKVLGDGVLTKKVTLEVHAVSEGVHEKLKKAGGQLTLIGCSSPSSD